jgi:hypothetical protein
VVVAVVSVLALCLALTSVYDGHLSNRDFFVAGAIFLLLYYVLHRMFVWQSSTQHASELATPLNIVFPVLVFALQSSISFSFIFTALNYLNASPNFCTSQQLQLWKWRDFVSLFLFFIVIGGLFAFLLSRRMLVLQGLAMLQLVLNWTSIMLVFSAFLGMELSTPIHLRIDNFRQYDGQEWILPVTIISLFVLHLCFALGVLASLLRLQPSDRSDWKRWGVSVSHEDAFTKERLSASSYLSSARMLSFVLIVFMLLAFDVARSSANRVSHLRKARDIFARQITLEALAKQPAFQITDGGPESYWTPVGQPEFSAYGKTEVCVLLSAKPVTQEKTGLSAQYKEAEYDVKFTVRDGRQWRSLLKGERERTARGDEDPRKWAEISSAMPQDFARILRYVGLPVDEVFKDGGSPTIKPQLFATAEELLLRQPVLIPSLGLGVEANEAAWILSLSVLALLVLLRSRVDECLKRLDSGIEQPWLILDARKGVERVVAGCWLLTIGMSPWVANGSLLAQLVSENYAQGMQKTNLTIYTSTTVLLVFVAIGGWLSYTCVSALLRLRLLRFKQESAHYH